MKNWSELKFQGTGPERRTNHASFTWKGKLYIHGGNDVNEGCLSNMWALDLKKATQPAMNDDMLDDEEDLPKIEDNSGWDKVNVGHFDLTRA